MDLGIGHEPDLGSQTLGISQTKRIYIFKS